MPDDTFFVCRHMKHLPCGYETTTPLSSHVFFYHLSFIVFLLHSVLLPQTLNPEPWRASARARASAQARARAQRVIYVRNPNSVWTATIARVGAFCSVFQTVQDSPAKSEEFCNPSHRFSKFRLKISQGFANFI